MTTLALLSVKHAPGATTAAVALAAAADEGALVFEVDPAGGDIAARARLSVDPGLLTLAAAGRHSEAALDLAPHLQRLPGGGTVVVAPPYAAQTTAALGRLGARLLPALRAALPSGAVGILDGGRWDESSVVTPVLRGVDVVLLVAEPSVAGIQHAAARIDVLRRDLSARVAVVLSGERPYGPDEVAEALFVPVLGPLPTDARGVSATYLGGPGLVRRSRLVRSARDVLTAALELAAIDREAATR